MVGKKRRYALADTAQQVVGGFLLAGPFVVTQEVWDLAKTMSAVQGTLTIALVLGIGYGALYKADHGRDPESEAEVGGVPLRYISLILVSYLSVFILALAFNAPGWFLHGVASDDPNATVVLGMTLSRDVLGATLKATSVGAIFSVIGAATADSVF